MNKIAIIIAFAVYIGLNYWLFVRGRQALPANETLQILYMLLFGICSLSFFVAMGLGDRLPLGVTMVLENIGAWWVIGLLYFFLAAFFIDLLRIANHFLNFFPDWVYSNYPKVKLITLLSVLGLFVSFSLIGNYFFRHPSVRQLEVEVPKGAGSEGSLTLAVASDVHLGNIIRKNRLRKYVDLLNRQEADLILFAGDLIDHSIRPVEAQRMDEDLRKLKARIGVYGIFGNHEYYGDVQRAEELYARSGITLLRDTAVSIEGRMVLAGRDDVSQHRRKPLEKILEAAESGLPVVLLDHNPARIQDAVRSRIDLQISGHTHNGQIFPINLIVKGMYEIAYGYAKIGNTHAYVSSGLGLWAAPVRMGSRSEIIRIQLNFK